jgi:hypothetical protein
LVYRTAKRERLVNVSLRALGSDPRESGLLQSNHTGVLILYTHCNGLARDNGTAGLLPNVQGALKSGKQRDGNAACCLGRIDHPKVSAARTFGKPGFHFRVARFDLLLDTAPRQETYEEFPRGGRLIQEIARTRKSTDRKRLAGTGGILYRGNVAIGVLAGRLATCKPVLLYLEAAADLLSLNSQSQSLV